MWGFFSDILYIKVNIFADNFILNVHPILFSESPRKSATPVHVASPAVKSRWSFSSSKKSFGSKDEAFFDTQQWLQSDSDDDFHSVNGDFTPSRGNTPKSSFSDRLPRINNLIFHEKKLLEALLQRQNRGGRSLVIFSEKEEKKKSNWQHHRCLPGFSACGGSFMERRKKMSSETGAVAVK
ncbi:hypothetical protein Bca52824_068466 [Brassica carinata]|uniref:Uncharacterized protein n=1 Tax=Brassica carinata TaxID=52824 RepID=A0A8X7Q2A3_BRACI|nr:hypothetical protein Bca52824_068466 [Brassica carinata]